MKPLLNVSDICFSYHTLYGETAVLSNISFQVFPKEFLAIVGPSGCGKSTLLDLICGLLPCPHGTITLHGQPVSLNSQIGYMLQKDHLLEWRSVYRNILLGMEMRHSFSPKQMELVENLIEKYDLQDFKKSKPSQLSGGMRQRAALIRTLCLNPQLLLLDEPFSALDYQTRLNVGNDIGNILKASQTPAILVTHDIAEAISMADRILVLSKRPCSIKKEVPISFPKIYNTPLKKRSAPDFHNLFEQIWKELNANES